MLTAFSCHRRQLIVFAAVALVAGCATTIRSTLGRPPTPVELSAFWTPPDREVKEQLLYGAGGREEAPDPGAVYTEEKVENSGYSPKMDVVDPSGRKWSVKMGPEAQSEVAVSRILWRLGYRQPPNYALRQWRVARADGTHLMGPGRFRPHSTWLKGDGHWSWYANPFVDSSAYRGLLVLMLMVNSTDLKEDNNEVYEVKTEAGRQRWYAVRDLGASLGETGWTGQRRNDIEQFEKHGFIVGTDGDRVRFEFHGRFKDLFQRLTAADVRWTCEKLDAVSAEEWREIFQAAGYDEPLAARFIARIRQKIAQGLSLSQAGAQ